MEIFYHGSSVLFDKFDLNHALEGDGKVKFGYGVYVTEKYKSAAHYSFNKNRPQLKDHYVYTVEIPDMTPDNHIFSCKPVAESVVRRTEAKLGKVPDEVKASGKLFRKYIGNVLKDNTGTIRQMSSKADIEAEKAASAFFDSIGLDFFVWPQSQANPDGLTNRAVLDVNKIKIIKIEKIELDSKNQLIEGSQKEIKL